MPNYVLKYDLNGIRDTLQAALTRGRVLSVVVQGLDLYIETDSDLSALDETLLKSAATAVRRELFKNAVDPETGRDEGSVEKKL